DLIWAEVLLREDLGERPALPEYQQRFPELAEPLYRQFDLHAALAGSLLSGLDAALPRASALSLSPEAKDLLGRFDSLWHQRQRPSIVEFLAACPEGERAAVLVEMIHSELEYRLQAGEAARVEDYLGRFPELAAQPAVVANLLAAEFRLRCRRDPAHHPAD